MGCSFFKLLIMNIFKHPKNGAYFIWAEDHYGGYIVERFEFYTKKEAIALFRKHNPASTRKTKGVRFVKFCPFVLC
jgi:hypothetical protein